MADPQGLFDVLAGAAGAPVDRPRLDAFVANSQASNGLRSAQTEEALLSAQRSLEEAQARKGINQHFINSGLKESDAQLATDMITAGAGNASQVMDALKTKGQDVIPNYTLGDPSQIGTAAAVAAAQARSGKTADPFTTVPEQYSVTPGIGTPPPVIESPLGQAKIDASNALAGLHGAQAHNASNPDATSLNDDAAFNAAIRYNSTGTMPTLGGNSAIGDRRKILQFAANLTMNPGWSPPSWSAEGSPGATPSQHPTAAQATAPVVTAATNKANTASLGDMTKRTAIADSSEQTAAANLKLAQHYLTNTDQTGSPLVNSVLNKIKGGLMGDPDVSAYTNALTTAANEYARVVSMATGAQGITDAARREGQALFNPSLAPDQLAANIKVALKEMGNRTGSMHTQIHLLQQGIAGGTGTDTAAATPAPTAGGAPNNDPLGIRGP